MSTVFYPGMGADIVTPLMSAESIDRIIGFGPVEGVGKKNATRNTFKLIADIVNNGSVLDEENDEWIDLFRGGQVTKQYFFRKKGMWLMNFGFDGDRGFEDERSHFDKNITLNYYPYNDANNPSYPFSDKVDYIIYKPDVRRIDSDEEYRGSLSSWRWRLQQRECLQKLKTIMKPDAKIVGTKETLRSIFRAPKEDFNDDTLVKSYEHIVEQMQTLGNEQSSLYCVRADRCLLFK